jgi:hypothetical protein
MLALFEEDGVPAESWVLSPDWECRYTLREQSHRFLERWIKRQWVEPLMGNKSDFVNSDDGFGMFISPLLSEYISTFTIKDLRYLKRIHQGKHLGPLIAKRYSSSSVGVLHTPLDPSGLYSTQYCSNGGSPSIRAFITFALLQRHIVARRRILGRQFLERDCFMFLDKILFMR